MTTAATQRWTKTRHPRRRKASQESRRAAPLPVSGLSKLPSFDRVDPGSGQLSYKDKQKQSAAAHSARMAILAATATTEKLADPALARHVAVAKIAGAHKKVADKLSPSKVQLLIPGDAYAAALAGAGAGIS